MNANTKPMSIVTHNGKFHADEVLATAVLMSLFPHAELVRSRDRKVIEEADIAVDVGGGCFDHHQRGGGGARPNGVAYSSIGLIWVEYGRRYVYETSRRLFGDMIDSDAVSRVKTKVDDTIIQELDMVDNGVIKGKERMHTCLSNIIAALNCGWLPAAMSESEDVRFRRAQATALQFLNDTIERLCLKELAVKMLERDMAESHTSVLELSQFYPWQEALAECIHGFLFTVFGSGSDWKVQTIQDFSSDGNAKTRIYLPEEWAGLQGEELEKVSGVPGAVFCHNGKFIAGANSKEAAMALAKKAFEYQLGVLRNSRCERYYDSGFEGDKLNTGIVTSTNEPKMPQEAHSIKVSRGCINTTEPLERARIVSGEAVFGKDDRLAAVALIDSIPPLDASVYLTPVTTGELRGVASDPTEVRRAGCVGSLKPILHNTDQATSEGSGTSDTVPSGD